MKRKAIWLVGLLVVAVAGLVTLLLPRSKPAPGPTLSMAQILGGEQTGAFRTVDGPRSFVFPRDHGPHPDYRNEWWYFTGNLADAAGRRFGYQLTFFRRGLGGQTTTRTSRWATNQAYMGHFALTDVQPASFYHWERFSRAGAGLAGAETAPFHVWLDHWSALETGAGPTGCAGCLNLELKAAEGPIRIELNLSSRKAVVLNGEQGYSRKSDGPGNASHYYSLTRLDTTGVIEIGAQRHEVLGGSWLDREWSTSALADTQEGWDWFALQLADGRELMFYRLRRKDGRRDTHSSGTLVDADGSVHILRHDEVVSRVLGYWRSPAGVRYPHGWSVKVPAHQLDLTVTPLLDNQELDLSIRYWEGASAVTGRAGDAPVEGAGYVELAGYGPG